MTNNRYLSVTIRLAWLALAGIFLASAPVVLADRYVVPTNNGASGPDYTSWETAATNIQDAVNVATNGETVWLTNGAYVCQGVSTGVHYDALMLATVTNTAMVVITNAITLKSWSGTYSNTIINGSYPTWTTRVVLAISAGAVLDGLTISNGCIVTNIPARAGTTIMGGAGVYFSGRMITNCLITHNRYVPVDKDRGANIYMNSDMATISHSIIRASIGSGAAGLYIYNPNSSGPWVISNCVITSNGKAGLYMAATRGPFTVANSDLSKNASYGIYIGGSNWLVSACTITNNIDAGMAAYNNFTTNCFVRNCLINSNGSYGMLLYPAYGKLEIENCTILYNAKQGITVATAYNSATNITVANSIIYYNQPYNGVTNWATASGTNAVYSHCCTTPMPTNAPGLPEGTDNITNAPVFVNANAANYRLPEGSPCINTGVNQDWMNNALDLGGRKRVLLGTVDMGAYEYSFVGTMFKIY